jgi:ribonuclease P protein component
LTFEKKVEILEVLPKKSRLVRHKEIQKTYHTKFKKNTNFSRIFLRKTDSPFKLLIVVSSKINKKANKRNRIKRKINAIFEKMNRERKLPSNVNCIIQVTSKEILFLNQEKIKKDIIENLQDLYFKSFTQSNFSKPR